MKYIIGFFSAIVLALIFILCPMQTETTVEYLRIHIRANSNSIEDQNVKYMVKDAIVEALIPILSDIESFDEAKKVVLSNFGLIENVANGVLKSEGFTYSSKADIRNEYFPSRTYENVTLEEGYYDALILELGDGVGDNWWCIVFPAFCFTKSQNFNNIVYISRIWEIIKSVT